MKGSGVCKVICGLLALLLLFSGSGRQMRAVLKDDSAIPEDKRWWAQVSGDYARVRFSYNHVSFCNANGNELHWRRDAQGELAGPPEPDGDMEFLGHCSAGDQFGEDIGDYIWTPYSKTFTVRSKDEMDGWGITFSAEFYRDSLCVCDAGITGDFEGTATIRDDNVIELNGENSFICVSFTKYKNDHKETAIIYSLEGQAQEHAKFTFTGDDIVAEGMIGEYELDVSKREH